MRVFQQSKVLSCLLAFFLAGCAVYEKQSELEQKIQSLEQDLKLFEENIDFLSKRTSKLQQALEELSAKVKQDLESLKELDVSLDTSPPPSSIPQAFLKQDQVVASQQGLSVRADLYKLLNSITRGNFTETIQLVEKLKNRQLTNSLYQIIDFWEFIAYVELKDFNTALRKSDNFISAYRISERAPFVMFRQAGIFEALGDVKARNVTLMKLINDFPKSVEAAEAKKILARK
ncbi:MAG: hypothetical protein NZT61_00660 [Deltaproteobacteria bacterium]|nr:hypothetical protein [Deltaproteobacteria bacterium]MCX7952990.1 hypothetical protein [Deltaproteobacteria bacterium]